MTDLEQDILKILLKHRVIDERSIRDHQILEEYKELRNKGISSKEARAVLAEKYCTGEKTIQYIIYRKKK